RIEQSRDRAQQRGLAGAVLAGEQHALSGVGGKAHAAQHMAIAAPQVKARDAQHARIRYGAPGRNRTGMALRPTDFKSVASTSSATGAWVIVGADSTCCSPPMPLGPIASARSRRL